MKILLTYLKPYKWLVVLTLFLAAINTGFSLIDPIIFGKLISLATEHEKIRSGSEAWSWHDFLFVKKTVTTNAGTTVIYGVVWLLLASITVAMISRIAKNFQDYFMNVVVQKFGAKVFTDGLKHAMKLPYQEFEDQRSGETLSILQKVRTDTERFINLFINVLFGVIVGITFVIVYAAVWIHWSIPVAYIVGIFLLTAITNLLSKKIKIIQKTIVSQTTSLAGTTT